ncbi:hypothetical protein TNCV_337781 [Trichonephila clavipes]|nr:hypothetical protein TNCV_337781 [Trichonephila clavipes]
MSNGHGPKLVASVIESRFSVLVSLETHHGVGLMHVKSAEARSSFIEGRNSLEDDERTGRLRSAITDQSTAKVRDGIRSDRRLNVHAVVELVHLDREAVRLILTHGGITRKIFVKVVPKVLSDYQK